MLGGPHRDLGALQQLARIVAVVGTHGHADAGADVDDVPVERHPHFEGAHHRLRDALGIADAAAGHQDGELVAADAGDAVVRAADDRAQPGRDLAQQHVADRMAERFVDMAEVIEIEDQHGDGRARARAGGDRLVEAIGEQHARRQARELVAVSELGHPRHVGRDACLHRAKRRDEVADLVLARRHVDRRVVAGAHAPGRGGDGAHRLDDAAREQEPDERPWRRCRGGRRAPAAPPSCGAARAPPAATPAAPRRRRRRRAARG